MFRARPARLLALGLLLLAPQAKAGGIITCCEDANGRRVCADSLPLACYGRAYREISPQGMLTRSVPAPMSPEERARAEEADKARKQAEEKAREQRRRDLALLNTYSSLDDLDNQRDRALADVQRELEGAVSREAEVLQRRAKLDQEAEFYTKKPMPVELAAAYRENDGELSAQRSVIASKQRDLEATKAKYESDRRRYAELQAEKAARR